MVNEAPVTENPVAPVVTTTGDPGDVVRSKDPPLPTKRLAPLMVKETTFAPSMVPATPAGLIRALPVTTSIVAISKVMLLTTATTVPDPILREALPVARS